MGKTKIGWTEEVWNPTRGCSLKSPGCVNCYAMRQARRMDVPGGHYEGLTVLGPKGPLWSGRVELAPPTVLAQPLSWRKPRVVFVNSMSDLFHEGLDYADVAGILGIMVKAQPSVFQVLTKRADRMLDFQRWLVATAESWHDLDDEFDIVDALGEVMRHNANRLLEGYAEIDVLHMEGYWPLPNVWWGISTENQATLDERLPYLEKIHGVVRFLSCEPLLEGLSFWPKHTVEQMAAGHKNGSFYPTRLHHVDWVIVGGESGYGARRFHIEWLRGIVNQCSEVGVPVYAKQLGLRPYHRLRPGEDHMRRLKLKDRKGEDVSEWPAKVPRCRDFPPATWSPRDPMELIDAAS